ncbi:DNA polymerase III subunit beta [Aureimonas ureilytica]|uniref:DNA polymerase III subunit beta n=1 Tax=Aureimonas ureilytica TaxID=401562 RepID=UPI000369E7AF|nr:DNA polymerase III subunit beta [Aureimonas ureilytica]
MTILAFACQRDTLSAALDRARKIVAGRNTIPILSNLLLRLDADGTLTIKGTDLDIETSVQVENVDVVTPGATTVPAAAFAATVAKMAAGRVIIDATDTALTVRAGRARTTFQTFPADDFPDISAKVATHTFTIPHLDLRRIYEKCDFAISNEETRYYLCGVYLRTIDGQLVATATDGHRLSRLALEMPDGAEDMPGIIIPDRTVSMFRELADKEDVPIQVGLSENFIRLRSPKMTIYSRLVDGTYPDSERIIPRGNNQVAIVELAALVAAIDRLIVLTDKDRRAYRMEFTAGQITMFSKADAGEAEDTIDAACDFDLTVGFNGKYLQDMCKTMIGPKLRLEMGDAGSPPLIRDEGDPTRELVLMPMRV